MFLLSLNVKPSVITYSACVMLLVKGVCEGHACDSHYFYFVTCNFGLSAQKSILHMCYFQGAHLFVTHKYQVTTELYHSYKKRFSYTKKYEIIFYIPPKAPSTCFTFLQCKNCSYSIIVLLVKQQHDIYVRYISLQRIQSIKIHIPVLTRYVCSSTYYEIQLATYSYCKCIIPVLNQPCVY